MDNLELIKLYDIYSQLLTKKQCKTFELYYLDDLSLREIAENLNISFQAVRYSLQSSKSSLMKFEKILNLNSIKESINKLDTLLLNEVIKNKEIVKIINDIKG